MVKLLFFSFQVNNSKLKNKQFHFELLTRWVNFYFFHYRVVNVDLANEKNLFKYYSSNVRKPLEIDITPLLRFLRTSYDSMSWGAKVCSKVGVAWMWSPKDGNLSDLCLGVTSFLVPETFKFKVLITWLPATYNDARGVNITLSNFPKVKVIFEIPK